ncbi:MAG: GNAT family N-acetyltransferase [Chthoniobacteraceae bacterium]|nr:GNAT family N-acetyltransferase [Chthoniobacteraceae bacterium]
MPSLRVEQATLADLPRMAEMLAPFHHAEADRAKQAEGLRFLLEHPSHGHIGVVRKEGHVIALACLISTISTAEGGFVLWLEDLVIDPAHREEGCGAMLLGYTVHYASENGFLRITALPEQMPPEAQRAFCERGFERSGMIPMRRLITA